MDKPMQMHRIRLCLSRRRRHTGHVVWRCAYLLTCLGDGVGQGTELLPYFWLWSGLLYGGHAISLTYAHDAHGGHRLLLPANAPRATMPYERCYVRALVCVHAQP